MDEPVTRRSLTVAQLAQIVEKTKPSEHVGDWSHVDDHAARGRVCLGLHVAQFNAPAAKVAWYATEDGLRHRRRSRWATALTIVGVATAIVLGTWWVSRDSTPPRSPERMVPVYHGTNLNDQPPVPAPAEAPSRRTGKRR